jgi:glycosyltransferase 2 family protein
MRVSARQASLYCKRLWYNRWCVGFPHAIDFLTTQMKRPGLKAALAVLKLTVSTVLLYVLLSRADLRAMLAQFRHMDLLWMGAALASYAVMLMVSAWRWRLLLQVQTVDVSFATLTRSFLVATFFNNFLPSNIGGDVVRVADTVPYAGSRTLATTVVLLDRLLGLIALLGVAAVASALASSAGVPLRGMVYVWLALGALGTGLFVTLAFAEQISQRLRAVGSGRTAAIQARLQNLLQALERFADERRSLGFAFFGAVAVQFLLVVFYVCAARSLAVPLPLMAASVIVPVSLAVQMAPVSINGFGVREAVFAFFFTSLGLDVSSALTLSLGSTALIMLFSLSGGGVFLLRRFSPPLTRV